MIEVNSFGSVLKMLREGRQLPLREVADAVGIDLSLLAKIEKNRRKPTKQLIGKLALYFKVSKKDLTVAFLSDTVVYQVLDEEEIASEVLKVAEKKIQYRRIQQDI